MKNVHNFIIESDGFELELITTKSNRDNDYKVQGRTDGADDIIEIMIRKSILNVNKMFYETEVTDLVV